MQNTIAQNGGSDFDSRACIPTFEDYPPRLFDGARPPSLVLEDTPLLSQPPLDVDARIEVVADRYRDHGTVCSAK